MESMCQYNLFGHSCDFDFTTVLGFLDTDTEAGRSTASTLSPVSSSSPSPRFGESVGQWKSLEQEICLILRREFTSDNLDDIRNNQRHDFCTNGIDLELDEYDRYQVNLRSSPPSYSSATKRTNVQPRVVQTKEREMTTRDGDKTWRNTVCVFCKNNGETLSVYGTHLLRDFSGRVTCPILRRYTCPICGASGDAAHTVKYCPLNNKKLY